MSNEAINWAYRQNAASAKFTLVTLADMADERHSCFPWEKTLSEKTGRNIRSVQRDIEALQALGLVRVEHRRGPTGHQTSNRYFLKIDDACAQIACGGGAHPRTTDCPSCNGNDDNLSPEKDGEIGPDNLPDQHDNLSDQHDNLSNQPDNLSPPARQSVVRNKITLSLTHKEPSRTSAHMFGLHDEFQLFWEAYPHRVAKATAKTAFAKACKKSDLTTLLEGWSDM